jgi:hypothetical protein
MPIAPPFVRASSTRGDHAAGDTRAGISGGIGHVIVRSLVDHQARTVAGEQSVRSIAERNVSENDLDRARLPVGHLEVRHIARVRALGVVAAVLSLRRVEMNVADTFTPSGTSCKDASPTFTPPAFFRSARALAASAIDPSASQPTTNAPTPAAPSRIG